MPTAWIAVVRAALTTLQSASASLVDWLALLIRFWLAQAFLVGAVVSVAMHAPLAMHGASGGVRWLNDLVASPLGFAIQTLCPILLLLGLFTRLAAIPLLVQALVLHGPSGPKEIELFWTVLIGWIIVMGPGAMSLDTLFGRSLGSIALPGVRRFGAVYETVTRFLGPVYELVLRLWVASAPAAVALAAYGLGNSMRRDAIAGWLASVPTMTAMMSGGFAALLSLMLILGIGTRVAALALIAMIPVAQVTMATDVRLYWLLVLAILVLRGGGMLSIDEVLDRLLTRLDRMGAPRGDLPHVVIVGGGFGGIMAARKLAGARCRITLVDQRNYHLFQPLLYQVATAGLSPAGIAIPIRSMFRTQANVRVRFATVTGVDPDAREVRCVDGAAVPYDYLVLATGAQHSYFGRDDWAGDAPGLKRVEDATEVRRRLLLAFEHAESTGGGAEAEAYLTFVVIGGGPTGVELAGAIAELARHGLHREFRSIDPASAKIILVQSAPRLLPTFPTALSADALRALKSLGVDVRLGARVEDVDAHGVIVSGERLPARTVLWAAGVAASPAGKWLAAETDKAGRLVVGYDLSVAGRPEIFAIGDTAASMAWRGSPVPGLAPAAKQGGQYVAKVIRARLAGRSGPRAFRYRHLGSLATIGRRAAVAEFGPVRLRGALAWWLWGAVHIMFLVGGRNRIAVMLDWAWAYFTYRRGTRLITEPGSAPRQPRHRTDDRHSS